ncbi:MAG: hypothetical protein FWG72_06385 [Oscillospiraceae bacterium]|nr:hypothetical protein [Oscillospiraceae bacterium]
MKTTKIFALAIALIMVFALAACSDSNNNTSGGGTSNPSPSQDPAPEPSAPSQDPDPGNGGNDPGTGDPTNGNGGDVIIPDNGTPPNVEPPLESHAGDKGYFYVLSDDYVVWTESGDNKQLMGGIEYGDNNGITYYVASFNENGGTIYGSGMTKYVFSSEADAAAFFEASGRDRLIQIGNVVYLNGDWGDGNWNHYKDGIIEFAPYVDMYISKP